MNLEVPIDQPISRYADEIDLRDVILPIWRCKYWIFLWGFMLSALVFVYQVGGFVIDKSDQAITSVHFNFKGADEGRYPNGASFSPQELVSNAVLGEVYKELIDPDVGYDNFSQSITLSPGFAGSSDLESVVTVLLGKEKGMSIAEFNDAIGTYTASLLSKSRTNIHLTLDLKIVNGDMQLASKVFNRILQIWAKQALQDKGVLSVVNQPIKPLSLSDNQDEILVRVNILSDTLDLLRGQVRGLQGNNVAKTVTDPETGLSLQDISHQLNMEARYKVAILKDLIIKSGVGVGNDEWHKGFRSARLGRLEREKDSLERMVKVYDGAISQFNKQQEVENSGSNSNQGGGDSTQVYSPQYNDDLVNSLLQLGSKMADPEYRKQLLQKKIELSSDLQTVITEIEFYKSGDTKESQVDMSVERINELINLSNQALNEFSVSVARIISIVNASYLDESGRLYDLFGATEKLDGSVINRSILLKLILAFFVGSFLAMISVFFRRVVNRPDPVG